MKKYRDIASHTVRLVFMLAVFFIPFVSRADTIISNQNDHAASGVSFGNTQGSPLFNIQYFNKAVSGDNVSVVVLRPKSLPAATYELDIGGSAVATADYDGVSPLLAFYLTPTTWLEGSTCNFAGGGLTSCYFSVVPKNGFPISSTSVEFYGTTTTPVIDHATGGQIYQSTGSAPAISNLTSLWFAVYTGTGFGSLATTTPLTPQSTFGFSTSTIASFCGSSATTSTSWLSGLANDFSYGICYSFAFLFVPSSASLTQFSGLQPAMQAKIPFSYVYEIKGIFDTLTASSTENLTALTINFPQVASTSPLGSLVPATIVGLSTTTIGTYLPDSVRETLLGMQRVSLWLLFGFLVYRRIIPHHVMTSTT